MKLYMHPVSMTSRPVRLFIAENNIPVDEVVVDLFTGEHTKPPYTDLNPNALVPMIEDGDLRLTESSAILKYLADKIGSPAYPKDLKPRAKVNEMMDWINTNFYRDWAYNLTYPQTVSQRQAPQRRGAGGHHRTRPGKRAALAQGAQRPLDRPEQPIPVRQPDHDRRLFRRRSGDARRGHPLRFFGLSQRRSAGSTT